MDSTYAQPAVLLFNKLPVDLICHLVVLLNGGTIGDRAMSVSGYLYPGYRGGRKLNYFKISRDAMTFWQHVCKYMRHTYTINNQTHKLLLSNNTPQIETWQDPHLHEYWDMPWQEYHNRVHYVPRHFYAGDPKPWIMMLCWGPQTPKEIEDIEAAEQAKIVAKEARKEKRRTDAAIALVADWGSGQRRLRARM